MARIAKVIGAEYKTGLYSKPVDLVPLCDISHQGIRLPYLPNDGIGDLFSLHIFPAHHFITKCLDIREQETPDLAVFIPSFS